MTQEGSRGSVLVAEAEASVARGISTTLGGHGLEVRWVRTVRDARRELRERPPDVLVLDVTLDTDGLEFFQALRGLPENPRGGVVVLAEAADVRSRERAHQLGAAAVLSKPLHVETLVSTVRELIELAPRE